MIWSRDAAWIESANQSSSPFSEHPSALLFRHRGHSVDRLIMQKPRPRTFALVALLISLTATGFAGLASGIRQNSVGGVMIDAQGVVRTASPQERRELASMIRRDMQPIADELAQPADTRVISLRGLATAMQDHQQNGGPLPDSIEYLAGLQRIDFVIVDEENHDVCLAGPAEPWVVADDGSVIGRQSGMTPIRLVDLMVALQSVETARNGGISCSIEPTAQGRRNLQTMLRRVTLRPGQNPSSMEPAMREAYGPQMILVNGVPRDSRLARTMVAADYEMKRIAMGLAASPINELPSYLAMARNSRHGSNQNPRWWMACDYEAIAHDADHLAFEISGPRVRTMTEQELVTGDGNVEGSGKVDPLAQAWADKMTEYYASLSKEISVFADLENAMDLAVATTLIVQEGLAERAGLDLTPLMQPSGDFEPVAYPVPESVDPQCSFIRGANGWVVTASGGVDISGFQVVSDQQLDENLAQQRVKLLAASESAGSRWFWDAEASSP